MKRNISILLFIVLGLFTWSGCATLPTDFERQESHVFKDTDNTTLGKGFQKLMPDNPDLSGFHLLGNGLDALVARAVLAKVAEKSIDTQYYMIHNDVVGSLFVDQLLKADSQVDAIPLDKLNIVSRQLIVILANDTFR